MFGQIYNYRLLIMFLGQIKVKMPLKLFTPYKISGHFSVKFHKN